MYAKKFCVHGHFYQPPRIDPFTNQIPEEFGSAPYSNWTEKIYHQCYLPNTNLGTFEKISFNIGPTLFAWMSEYHPDTVQKIIDQENQVYHRTGISNAVSQPYFHVIMPLASYQDKHTMVCWGIREYEKRYGHKPSGMWLPETAVDNATLQVLSDQGIEFTFLAPWQSQDSSIISNQPFRVSLSNSSEIIIFFYNSFLSGEISFNPAATNNADTFVHDWLSPQINLHEQKGEQLILVASDGELYGHHQEFLDLFLNHLLDGAVESASIQRTYPAQWLREHPAKNYISIKENSSWSCHHGIERWRDVCEDAPSAAWKKPLRQFLDALSTSIDDIYEANLRNLIHDPWKLRDEYIEVILGSTDPHSLIEAHVNRHIHPEEFIFVERLLKAQFERLRMFSSDAWFYYDLDRIEPLNALKYAAHATSLVENAVGIDPSEQFISIISKARSELSGLTGDMAFLGFLKKFEKIDIYSKG